MRPLALPNAAALLFSLLLLASSLVPSTAGAAPSGKAATSPSTCLTFLVPASPPSLPNPYLLSGATTTATLTALGRPTRRTTLSAANTFVFHDLAPGSYLLDVHCASHVFAPMRVDVLRSTTAGGDEDGGVKVRVWETFRGNDWENKGLEVVARSVRLGAGDVPGDDDEVEAFDVKVWGAKNYFNERSTFSVLSVFKNPMILLGLVSMGIFFGMPYLVDNMDPEMRAEWDERQKTNPMNNLLGGGAQPGPNPMGNFDVAGFLAGSAKKEPGSATPPPSSNSGGGGGGGGGKKGKR